MAFVLKCFPHSPHSQAFLIFFGFSLCTRLVWLWLWFHICDSFSASSLQCCASSCDCPRSSFQSQFRHNFHMYMSSCHVLSPGVSTSQHQQKSFCHIQGREMCPSSSSGLDQLIKEIQFGSSNSPFLSISVTDVIYSLTVHIKTCYKMI